MENGLTYTKHRVYKDTFERHCVVSKSCRQTLKKENEHTYEPNSKIFYCNEVKGGVKRRVA